MEKEKKYSIIIPYYVLINNKITSNEKLLFGIINKLTKKTFVCNKNNNYFAKKLNVHRNSISRMLKHLDDKCLIEMTIKKDNNKQIIERQIRLF